MNESTFGPDSRISEGSSVDRARTVLFTQASRTDSRLSLSSGCSLSQSTMSSLVCGRLRFAPARFGTAMRACGSPPRALIFFLSDSRLRYLGSELSTLRPMIRRTSSRSVGRPVLIHAAHTLRAFVRLDSTLVCGESADSRAAKRGASAPKMFSIASALWRYHPRLTLPAKATCPISICDGNRA